MIDDEPAATEPGPAPLAERRALAAEHPLVQRTSELFGARLVRVESRDD
jgi:hypothetical protein